MKTRGSLRAIAADCTGESPGESSGIQPAIAAGRTLKDEVPAPRNSTTGAEKVNSKICASEITVTLFGWCFEFRKSAATFNFRSVRCIQSAPLWRR